MCPRTEVVDASLRLLRIIRAALLGFVVLYAAMGELEGPKEPKDVKQMQLILMVLAVSVVVTLSICRQVKIRPAEDTLRSQPEDAVALARWRAGNIVTFVVAEAVALYGLVLRFLGGTFLQALPFYTAAAVLMLVFTPRRPE